MGCFAMADHIKEPNGAPSSAPATPRPAWTAPEMLEMNIWSDTAAKGTTQTESITTKTS